MSHEFGFIPIETLFSVRRLELGVTGGDLVRLGLRDVTRRETEDSSVDNLVKRFGHERDQENKSGDTVSDFREGTSTLH